MSLDRTSQDAMQVPGTAPLWPPPVREWWYAPDLRAAESDRLAGEEGPMARVGGPGVIERLEKGVRIDGLALRALSVLSGEVRVEWADLIPVLRIGDGSWPLVRRDV